MDIFEKSYIGKCELNNRIIRSATFEGMCDDDGYPGKTYYDHYRMLSRNEIGGIITGFSYIKKEGRAMHPGQAGIDDEFKIPYFRKMTEEVHRNGSRIFMQIFHAGRQTKEEVTGTQPVGCSPIGSSYFKDKPRTLSTEEVYEVAEKFGQSALFTKKAGFDGIQLHAAHGYLVHQFILPYLNTRKDEFSVDRDSGIGTSFLGLVMDNIRLKCGQDYPLLVKVSRGDDLSGSFTTRHFISLIRFLAKKKADAVEVSYGTMDHALNIFRGGIPLDYILKYNPVYKHESRFMQYVWKNFISPGIKKRFHPFTPMYNLHHATLAKRLSNLKIISVGGFRSYEEISQALRRKCTDFVALSRPFIREPDLVRKIKSKNYQSSCKNCNKCAIMCDSLEHTQCYNNKKF